VVNEFFFFELSFAQIIIFDLFALHGYFKVKTSDSIYSGPKRYHYRPDARAFSIEQFVHQTLYSDGNMC